MLSSAVCKLLYTSHLQDCLQQDIVPNFAKYQETDVFCCHIVTFRITPTIECKLIRKTQIRRSQHGSRQQTSSNLHLFHFVFIFKTEKSIGS